MSERRNGAESELDSDGARIRQRLRALRSRYPGVALTTSLTHIHDDQVVLRAALTLPDGSSVSAHAAEPADNSGLLDVAIELAEQRAIARVMDLLGLGDIPPARDPARAEEPAPIAPEPRIEEATPPLVDALRKATQRRQAAAERPEPIPPRSEAAPIEQPAEPTPVEQPAPEPEPAADLDMADFSWTDFWKWARANDLSTKGQVEQRIGRGIDGLTAREVRVMLQQAGVPL